MHILGACKHIYIKYEVSMSNNVGGLYTHDTDADTDSDTNNADKA